MANKKSTCAHVKNGTKEKVGKKGKEARGERIGVEMIWGIGAWEE